MSIHFISGKPGGGKSLYGVRLILDELLRGNRVIVTNVPLNLGRINEYLDERSSASHFGLKRFISGQRDKLVTSGELNNLSRDTQHISERVLLITEDELPQFFTFRGAGVRLKSVSNSEWKAGERPDFSKVLDGGVFYVLDEVHIAFNSRAWADTGAEVLYYLSQHRKLGDDVVCITQSVGNVDKQFRSVAQDFTYIKNLSKQRAGLFRLPAVFARSTYAKPATDKDKPDESGTFTLDMSGVASCYDTAKGVGIHGRSGADINARKTGFHWAWCVVGFPLLLWAVVHYTPSFFVNHVFSPVKETPSSVLPPSNSVSTIKSPDIALDNRQIAATTSNQLCCVGYSVLFGHPKVFMSDGTTKDDSQVQVVEKSRVLISGIWYSVVTGQAWSALPDYVQPEAFGQISERSRPVNSVIVGPTIHPMRLNPAPRLNGVAMQSASLSAQNSNGQR